jgi:hypothetical protein
MKIQGDFGVIAQYIYITQHYIRFFFKFFTICIEINIQNIVDSNLLYSKIRLKELIFFKASTYPMGR